MADPEHPLTRLLRGELWTWSDDRTSPRRGGWGSLQRPLVYPLSLLHYHLPCSCRPFHLLSIAGSGLLASGRMVSRGWEVMDGAAGDMGKGRINTRDKEKGIFISVFELLRQWQWSKRKDFSSPLQLRWLYTFFF